ncbi:MAG: hypothetical protein AB1730_16610 [Myxococcota bacterium]|jgi:hypothetical protein
MLNKVRLIIFVVLVVPALLIGLGAAAYTFINGKGDIELVAPADADLSYSLDSGPKGTVKAGGHLKIAVEQGKHGLELESAYGKAQRTVEVTNGFQHLLVPADDNQCFVVLDVSRSHYQYGSKTADKYPTVKARVRSSDIYDLPGSLYFSEKSLPANLKEGRACNLLVEVECKHLEKSDSELMVAMGY